MDSVGAGVGSDQSPVALGYESRYWGSQQLKSGRDAKP